MTKWHKIGLSVISAALIMAQVGCIEDDAPLAPTPGDGPGGRAELLAAMSCRVEVAAGSISCTPNEIDIAPATSPAVLGGQGTYVLLESSNVAYDPETEIFSTDVTVRNMLTQPMGTSDGSTLDPEGVRVFFMDEPVAYPGGSGPVTVDNADGKETFTKPDQHFFRYPQVLGPGKRSLPKTWHWKVPHGVESFSFGVYVAAAVAEDDEIVGEVRIDGSSISAGRAHTCALSVAGKAYCWGYSGYGQGGHGDPEASDYLVRPVAVKGPGGGPSLQFASITAGGDHSCALTVEGKAYCWGDNGRSQLGVEGVVPRSTPVAVSGPEGETVEFTSITAGDVHTCALATTGRIYCWGHGEYGALGTGSTSDQPTPVPVLDTIDGGVRFVAVDAGVFHTCALSDAGKAYCWGHNHYGKLGIGEVAGGGGLLGPGFSDYRLVPHVVLAPEGEEELPELIAIDAGHSHTCALAVTGMAYCWGLGSRGRLGNNETSNSIRPVAVVHPEGVRFTSIVVGGSQSCALTADGRAYCWGDGEFGQLGNAQKGLTVSDSVPVPVVDPPGGPVRYTTITAGSGHTCGSATNGKAYCWGHDGYGQLGNGGTLFDDHMPSPDEVVNPAGGPDLIFAASPLRRLPLLAYLGERAGHDRYPRG